MWYDFGALWVPMGYDVRCGSIVCEAQGIVEEMEGGESARAGGDGDEEEVG